MYPDEEVDVELESEIQTHKGFVNFLVLWNDDFNTFEHVIACLIKYVGKAEPEAEKIAFIVHTKGRCIILEGAKSELIECYHILRLKNLTVSIE